MNQTYRKYAGVLALAVLLSVAATPVVRADTVAYISDTTLKDIRAWDVDTNSIAWVTGAADGERIDSLMLVDSNQIIYTTEPIVGLGTIGSYICGGFFAANGTCSGPSTNTVLSSSPLLNEPSDLVMDPTGTSFLVANSANNTVDRVNLLTGATVLLHDFGTRIDGLAYDGAGHLFASLSQNSVSQIDPLTGAILKTISTPNIVDGLAYDAGTGRLYAGADGSVTTGAGGFYTIDPSFADGSAAVLTQVIVGGNPAVIDGIAAKNNLLYLIQRNIGGIQYDLNTGMVTETSPLVDGADDIAAAVTNQGTPEPGTFVLIGGGMLVIGAVRRKMKA